MSKICTKCHKDKSLEEFSKHTCRGKTRLRAYCRECASRLFKKYYKKRHKYLLQKRRNYSKLKYQQDKNYYKKENQKYINKWRMENPLQHKAIYNRRRAKLKNIKGSFTAKDIEIIYIKQQYKCFYCNAKLLSNYHIDHKIPISRGGTNYPRNLALTCPHCNLSKKNKTSYEYFRIIQRISN